MCGDLDTVYFEVIPKSAASSMWNITKKMCFCPKLDLSFARSAGLVIEPKHNNQKGNIVENILFLLLCSKFYWQDMSLDFGEHICHKVQSIQSIFLLQD